MQKSFTDINKLINFLKLDKTNQKKILKETEFPLLLPFRLAQKIKKNDLEDPILRQFVPLIDETKEDNFLLDPLCEQKFTEGKLLKKYNNRALLISSNRCFMNCRFCFRKNFEYKKDENFEEELKKISQDQTIKEIILSGGDPLFLSNKVLEDLMNKLDQIKHLKRIRFHTRSIIAYPERIDEKILEILKKSQKQIVFVFHINHPIEIDRDVEKAISKLHKQHFLLFSQSVLLKGINDSFDTLKELFEKLIPIGIVPYYLHQLYKIKSFSYNNDSMS